MEETMNGISKFTLIIMILWTFFWIAVGAQGTVTGIVVYLFVGLPSTLFGWFLWWLKHPEEKAKRKRLVGTLKKPIKWNVVTPKEGESWEKFKERQDEVEDPTEHKTLQERIDAYQQQAQARAKPKPPKVKKKKDVMHYLRCGNISCHLEEFLENEADGQQHCTKCDWRKR
jgi:hypothetical protein